jgi:hypothetical protein
MGWFVEVYHCWNSHFKEGKLPDTVYLDSNRKIIKDVKRKVHQAEKRRQESKEYRDKNSKKNSCVEEELNEIITEGDREQEKLSNLSG